MNRAMLYINIQSFNVCYGEREKERERFAYADYTYTPDYKYVSKYQS